MLIGLHKWKKPKDAEKGLQVRKRPKTCGKRPAYADKTTDA